MAKCKSWMEDVPWLCCCLCAERASERCTLYMAQQCAHMVCGKCRENCISNCCPKCKMEQVEYARITADIQNSPFSDFFGDINTYADDIIKAHEFQNKHFLESCAREHEMARQGLQYFLPSLNETVALENKVKQMKSWKKKALATCTDLDRRRKALLELCRLYRLPVPNNVCNNISVRNCQSAGRRVLTPNSTLSKTPCSLGPPPCPPPVPSGLRKVSGSLHRQWRSPLPLKGRPSLFQSKSQISANPSSGSQRGVPPLHAWSREQLSSPMDTTT